METVRKNSTDLDVPNVDSGNLSDLSALGGSGGYLGMPSKIHMAPRPCSPGCQDIGVDSNMK